MRRSGKTTRMTDEAVQALFTYGRIFVPNLERVPMELGLINEQVFVDPDADLGNYAQRHLRDNIIQRVEREHRGTQVTRTDLGELTLIPKSFGK